MFNPLGLTSIETTYHFRVLKVSIDHYWRREKKKIKEKKLCRTYTPTLNLPNLPSSTYLGSIVLMYVVHHAQVSTADVAKKEHSC